MSIASSIPSAFGYPQQHGECWVVLAALQPRDRRLAHPQALGEHRLVETVLGSVGDHLHRDRSRQGSALSLPAVLGVGVQVRDEHLFMGGKIGELHGQGYIKLVMAERLWRSWLDLGQSLLRLADGLLETSTIVLRLRPDRADHAGRCTAMGRAQRTRR